VKVTAPQDVLAAVTGWVAATAATGVSGPLSPVLGGMLLTAAADGTLTAARFGYDASATAALAAETGEPGTALLGARLLAQAAASLPAGQARCELHWLDITAGWEAARLAATVRAWRNRRDLTAPYALPGAAA